MLSFLPDSLPPGQTLMGGAGMEAGNAVLGFLSLDGGSWSTEGGNGTETKWVNTLHPTPPVPHFFSLLTSHLIFRSDFPERTS